MTITTPIALASAIPWCFISEQSRAIQFYRECRNTKDLVSSHLATVSTILCESSGYVRIWNAIMRALRAESKRDSHECFDIDYS